MNKVGLIIRREYLTRVSNKRFILTTFLIPVVFILFIAGSVYFASSSKEQLNIAVINDPGYLKSNLKNDTGNVVFSFSEKTDTSNYKSKNYDAALYVAEVNGTLISDLHSEKQVGFEATRYIERQLNKAVENNLLLERGINKSTLDSIADASEENVSLTNMVDEGNGKSKEANTGIAYAIGFGSGFLIYMTMFIFGAMVMRGVAEEKTNRIAEVIVSSCKPFELMMGKIVGIAGVGLTQLLLWITLMTILTSSLTAFIPAETYQQFQAMQQGQQAMGTAASNPMAMKILQAKTEILESVNWLLIIGCFLFYFLGGYLFYASLFAAVGSVIDEDPQEAQALMLPITMPIIFSFVILGSVLSNPGSSIAIWTSILPFTSPIIMMGRIPFGVPSTVPYWQLAASMLSLIGGFLLTTWFAGKIYRTGILMYGKKVTWKEMIKWSFRKN
jgi:ABC-2 type transport system permease protein